MYEAIKPADIVIEFLPEGNTRWSTSHLNTPAPVSIAEAFKTAYTYAADHQLHAWQYRVRQGGVIYTMPPFDGTFITKTSDTKEQLAGGMVRSTSEGKTLFHLVTRGPMLRRWAELLTRGAKVYGADNWMLALKATDPVERQKTKDRYQESAFRHFIQFMEGDRTEDHAAAVIFNLNGYEAMLATDPKEPNAAK